MEKCVLACIHGGQMLDVVRGLRKEFDVPIISFVIWEYAEKELNLTPEQMKDEGILYSFPQYYYEHIEEVEKLPWSELDRLQVETEDRLGIPNNTMLVSYERSFLRVNDYRKARNIQLLNLMFAEMMLSEISPIFFLCGREAYLRNILADALINSGIPSMSTTIACHLEGRLIGLDSRGRQLGMPEAFERLMTGGEVDYDAGDIKEADDRLEEFLNRPTRPDFVDTNSRSFVKCAKVALTHGMKAIYNHMKLYLENRSDRETGVLESSVKSIQGWPAKAVRMSVIEHTDFLVKEPDYSRKFFYLPLHYTPEVTDMFYGSEYSHHEGFVMNLAKRLPSDCCLYVKDHTSMVGLRTLSFYSRLKKQYNIEMINPNVSTFDLLGKCEAVVTVTGTAGWEGYLMNKPVVVLGDVFYNFLPGVLHANLFEKDFLSKVKEYLADFTPDAKERQAAMRANCVSSKLVSRGFNGVDLFNVQDHAQDYAHAVKHLFDLWEEWLIENNNGGKGGRVCEE